MLGERKGRKEKRKEGKEVQLSGSCSVPLAHLLSKKKRAIVLLFTSINYTLLEVFMIYPLCMETLLRSSAFP